MFKPTLKYFYSVLAILGILGGFSVSASAQQGGLVRLQPGHKTGSVTANNGTVTITPAQWLATVGIQVTGTFSGTLTPQCSQDGTNFVAIRVTPRNTTTAVTTITSTGGWTGTAAACASIRVIGSGWASGTAVVTLDASESGGGGNSGDTSIDLTGSSFSGNAAASNTGAAVPAAASYTGFNSGGNLVGVSTSNPLPISDAGGSLTIDGSLTNISGTISLPTGAATSAKQDTSNTSLASIDGKITAVNTGAVVLAAGSAVVGHVINDASSAVIGHVIVDSGGGGGTQFAEDTASQNGDIGTIALARRTGTPANTSGADGDLEYLQVNAGRLWTSAIIESGTITCSNCSGTGVAVNEDVASANADPGTPSYTVRSTTLGTTTSANGDYQPAKSTDGGAVWTSPADTGGTSISDVTAHAIKSLLVDTAGTALSFGVDYTEDVASAGGESGTLFLTIRQDTPAGTTSADGDFQNLKTDSIGRLWVNCGTGCSGGTQYAEDTASADGQTGTIALARRAATPGNTSGTDGDLEYLQVSGGRLWASATIDAALPTGTNTIGVVKLLDPCSSVAKVYVPFNISSATTTQLIAASSSNYNYICSINIVTAAADNVGLIEDDTSACASPTAGMAGGTTAASGWNFAANGGMTHGDGSSTVFKTAATNRYACLITSSTAQLSGTISYVQAP